MPDLLGSGRNPWYCMCDPLTVRTQGKTAAEEQLAGWQWPTKEISFPPQASFVRPYHLLLISFLSHARMAPGDTADPESSSTQPPPFPHPFWSSRWVSEGTRPARGQWAGNIRTGSPSCCWAAGSCRGTYCLRASCNLWRGSRSSAKLDSWHSQSCQPTEERQQTTELPAF